MLPEEEADKFKLISQVGSGSFGRCFLCERHSDRTQVVLKKVALSEDAKNEARLLGLISHENVVTAYETYLSHRSVYIVLEYMAGGDLHDLIKRNEEKPLKDKTVVSYTSQLAAALAHIHDLRIIHRDVKPRNVLLSQDRKIAKLCDFGIALQLEEGQRLKGSIGEAGTINYIAPEILDGREYDFKCDIWSLGCVLYEMVERRRAFPGNQELAVFHKICNCIISFPDSSKLRDLLRELLTSSDAARPTAKETLNFLETLRDDASGSRRLSFWKSKKTTSTSDK